MNIIKERLMSFTALKQIPAYCVTLIFILGLAAPARAQVLEQDSLALVALYNATDGPYWTTSTNWLNAESTVSSWYGVTVTGDRVTGLSLASNELAGQVPTDVANLTGLTSLDLSDNLIEDLPDLTALTALTSFDVSGNALTFEDLEPNIDLFSSAADYAPQDSVDWATDWEVPENTALTLELWNPVGGGIQHLPVV